MPFNYRSTQNYAFNTVYSIIIKVCMLTYNQNIFTTRKKFLSDPNDLDGLSQKYQNWCKVILQFDATNEKQ